MQEATHAMPAPAAAPVAAAPLGRLDRIPVPAFAVSVCALLALVTLAFVMRMTGGTLVYSLDDPYIHLALAERLAQGHYGINPGEITSPSSSVIWPFLMIPFAGTALHAWMPLILTLGCGLVTAWMYGRFAAALPMPADDPWEHVKRLALAGLLVVAGNTIGLAFTGLEHTMQLMVGVAAAIGLIEVWQGRPLPVWALAAAAVGPAVRYEMFAITAAVALVLAGQHRWRAAAGLLAASLVLPVALGAFLVANGNLPLPNSVISKLDTSSPANGTLLQRWLTAEVIFKEFKFKVVLAGILAVLAMGARRSSGATRYVLAAGALAAVLHFAGGRFGWFHRYEVYAIVFCGLLALWAIAKLWPSHLSVAGAVVAVTALFYSAPMVKTPAASFNIYEQQYQMGRFVKEFWKQPFAVNDLGLVSFQRDPSMYVLDLWGLASNEAARTKPKTAAWLDDITRRHNTGLAIIYPDWFDETPANWTPVAEMHLSGRRITPAVDSVVFYATGVGNAAAIRAKLEAFKPTLPASVRLDFKS